MRQRGEAKEEAAFNRLRDGRQHWCRDCFSDYFRARGDLHRRQAFRAKAARKKRDRTYVREYLATHACVDCGESDLRVLDFDHIGDKTLDVCEMVLRGAPLAALAAEIERCEVVCANCHRRRTATRAGWWRLDLTQASFKNWKQRRNVEFAYEYLANSRCADCSLSDPVVLEFDHVGVKRAAVMTLVWDGYSLASIRAEIDQTEVRCCNCHRRRTAERRERPEAV